jgi:hypothetical protein
MTTLYRYYDAGGALLYVGIADDWQERLKTHQREAAWFGKATSLDIERPPPRKSPRAYPAPACAHDKPTGGSVPPDPTSS